MKKFLSLAMVPFFTLLLLTACGGNNEGRNGTSAEEDKTTTTQGGETDGKLTPPTWLIGSWVTTDGANPQSENIEVTARNVVISSGKLDMTWQINNVGLKVNETTDGNVYRLAYKAAGMDFSYTFTLQEGGGMACAVGVGDVGVTSNYTKK